MPGETLITDAAPAAAAASATPAAPGAGAAPAAAAPAAGTPTTFDAATGKPVDDGAAGTGAAEDGKGNEPGEKTPEQKAADEAAAAEAAKAAAGAPEKYEAFTPPEGAVLDAAVMGKFEETARALNLPQDKAQQLINEMAPVMAARQAEQIEQLRTEWKTQSTADKEFGGDKLTESMVHAKKALDTFATPELKTILNETGLGNHPELVRFMVRAGKAIAEDGIVTGGTPASANRSAAEVLYGGAKK